MSGITQAVVEYGYSKAIVYADRAADFFLQCPDTGDWHIDLEPNEPIQHLALAVERTAFNEITDDSSIFTHEWTHEWTPEEILAREG